MDPKTQKLVDSLWSSFEPDIERDKKARWQETSADLAQFGSTRLSEESMQCQFADRIVMEAFSAVKAELGDKILMKLSEPSRFEVMYVECLLKHSAEFKRSKAPEFQREIDGITSGVIFDVEKDIRETEAELRKVLESKFKIEMLYWSALSDGRLQDASAFLTAIELARSATSSDLQIEALNWRVNLALSLNDLEMFKAAFKKVLEQQDQFSDFRGAMAEGVRILVTAKLLKGLDMQPSDFGLAQASQSGKDIPAYFEEQAHIFLREAYLEIVDKLCANPDLDLLVVARMTLSEKRRSYLRVNPCFRDILFVENKKS